MNTDKDEEMHDFQVVENCNLLSLGKNSRRGKQKIVVIQDYVKFSLHASSFLCIFVQLLSLFQISTEFYSITCGPQAVHVDQSHFLNSCLQLEQRIIFQYSKLNDLEFLKTTLLVCRLLQYA